MSASVDIKSLNDEDLNALHYSTFNDLVNYIGDTKDNVILLLELERELNSREH